MPRALRYKPKSDPFRDLLRNVARERSADDVLRRIVDRLTAAPQVALCRIWLTRPICGACADHAPGREECLHLAASAGRSRPEVGVPSDTDGDEAFPVGQGRIGEIAATGDPVEIRRLDREAWLGDPDWIEEEGIVGFGAEPLVYDDRVLGVLAVCTRIPLEEEWLGWLRMIADQAAATIAKAREFDGLHSALDRVERHNRILVQDGAETTGQGPLIGDSPAARQTFTQIELAAQSDAGVLIRGETGAGRTSVAGEIHRRSGRNHRPLVPVRFAGESCDDLDSVRVRFETAAGGTLLLDGAHALPLETQDTILECLDAASDPHDGPGPPRLIATTDADLKTEVAEGRFRDGLYFRLGVLTIEVAPLRERQADIPLLAGHFVERATRRLGRPPLEVTEAVIDRLCAYNWPGNVRELQNVIERSVIVSRGRELRIDLVSLAAPAALGPDAGAGDGILTEDQMVELQKQNLRAALDRTGWKIYGPGGTAELLGLRPTTLASRIKKFDLKRDNADDEPAE